MFVGYYLFRNKHPDNDQNILVEVFLKGMQKLRKETWMRSV